jgi:hypothetical protein
MSKIVRFRIRFIVTAIVAVCALSIVNASSGLSQFSAGRDVKMMVADSENAFISLPEKIEVNMSVIDEKDKNDGESGSNQQELAFKVKNNLGNDIKLIKIAFEDPDFPLNFQGEYIIPKGEEKEISVGYNGDVKSIFENFINTGITERTTEAVLYFKWDGGSCEIYRDFVIYFEPMEEKSMEQTQEKGTGEDTGEKEGTGEDTEQKEDTDENTEQVQGAGENVQPDNGIQENTSLEKNTEGESSVN